MGGKWRADGPARLGGEGAPGCQEVRGWRGWATDGEPGGHTRLAFAKVPLASWRSRQGPWVVGGGWQPSRQELGASYKSCIKEGCAWQLRDGAKGEAGGPGGPRTCSLSIRSMQGALLKWKGRCPGLGRWAVWAGSGSSRVSLPTICRAEVGPQGSRVGQCSSSEERRQPLGWGLSPGAASGGQGGAQSANP